MTIDPAWLTASEKLILNEALLKYATQLTTIRKRAMSEDAKDDAKWRLFIVEQLRAQVSGR